MIPIETSLESGEICVAGNTVTDGYDQMPGATEIRFTYNSMEFHRMGDLGYWDKKGNLRFMGRKAGVFELQMAQFRTEKYEPFVNSISRVREGVHLWELVLKS